MFLIRIDKREKVNTDIFNDIESKKQFETELDTLTISDYGVYYKGVLIFIIERKTWVDLACSIKDQRLEQQLIKMATVEDRTDLPPVSKIIIVEGKKKAKHGKIPIASLETKLDSVMFRTNMNILYTNSFVDTAKRIVKLIDHYPCCKKIDAWVLANPTEGGKSTDKLKDELKTKIVTTFGSIKRRCLCATKGVAYNTALLLEKWTLQQLFNEVTIDDIKDIKYESGTLLGLTRAKKIIKSFKYDQAKILSAIPGLTAATAKIMLKNIKKDTPFTYDTIVGIQITEKRKLGPKLSKKIMDIITYSNSS